MSRNPCGIISVCLRPMFRPFLLLLPLVSASLSQAQDCRTALDSVDLFSQERFLEVTGPEKGLYPRFTFIAEGPQLYLRLCWGIPEKQPAVVLKDDPLMLKLTNGQVLDLRVEANSSSILGTLPTNGITEMTFDLHLEREQVKALAEHWVSHLRMHFTTGGVKDLNTAGMSVWPMDLAHTARCFLQRLDG